MVRDAMFYVQLGFEHGFGGLEESYPDNPDYRDGFVRGREFRTTVLECVPSIESDDKGNLFVAFRYLYALSGIKERTYEFMKDGAMVSTAVAKTSGA